MNINELTLGHVLQTRKGHMTSLFKKHKYIKLFAKHPNTNVTKYTHVANGKTLYKGRVTRLGRRIHILLKKHYGESKLNLI